MVSLDIAEKAMKNGIFVFNELCVHFFAGLLGIMLGGGTSRIMKFDAKDK